MELNKLLIVVVITCIFSEGFAQKNNSHSEKRFSYGISFSPDYTYRALKSDVDDIGFIDMRNESESARFGFTTGLTVRYLLNKRLVLESGLQYADRGDKMETDDADYVFPDNGDDPFVPDKTKTINHYYFLGIPIKANFYLVNKRTKVFLSAGISADFFSGTKTKQVHTFNGKDEVSSYSEEGVDFSNVNFVGLAGLGIDYRINEKLELRFEPIVRYSFSSLTTYSDLKTYLYSVGANFAIYFRK